MRTKTTRARASARVQNARGRRLGLLLAALERLEDDRLKRRDRLEVALAAELADAEQREPAARLVGRAADVGHKARDRLRARRLVGLGAQRRERGARFETACLRKRARDPLEQRAVERREVEPGGGAPAERAEELEQRGREPCSSGDAAG